MAKPMIAAKALTQMAEALAASTNNTTPEAISAIKKLLRKNEDVAGVINLVSAVPAGRFSGSAGRLAAPTQAAQEMADFILSLTNNPRTLTKRDFPRAARALGMQPVEGVVYGRGGRIGAVSNKALRQMQSNIEAAAYGDVRGVPGDPNFYWQGNRLITESVPNVDETLAAFTFAPFSAGSAVPENIRRWQRFVENPEMFPGRFPGEGGQTVGNAWADALRILGRDTPDVTDLSTSGQVVKVGSFGENLLDPERSARATVDRHAVKNALGIYIPNDVKIDGKKIPLIPDLGDERTYRNLERPFIELAAARGVRPHEVQSAAWDTWRRMMQANPDASLLEPEAFVPLRVSPIFDLAPTERKAILKKTLGQLGGRDAAWMKRAGLD